MDCRPGCAACCIAPSISTLAKPAGVPCRWLDASGLCSLYGRPERPPVCVSLRPDPAMCGATPQEAMAILARLEALTTPTAAANPCLQSIDHRHGRIPHDLS